MYPSYQQLHSNEFKSEPVQYDPYFPSQVSSTVSSSAITSTGIDSADHYNTYQPQPHQQGQPQNGGCYNQYSSQQSWGTGSPPGSQPSPQYFRGPGPGPGDGPPGGGNNNGNNGIHHNNGGDFGPYNSNYPGDPGAGYYPPPQQCNQYDQYNQYNYNGQQWHPPPGASPPLYGYGGMKSEHYEMKPSPPTSSQGHHGMPPPQQQSHPGAITHPYYQGGNGHISPHSPHLMGMPQSPLHQQPSPLGMDPSGWPGPPGPGNGPPMPGGAKKRLKPESHPGMQPKITDEFKAAKKPRSNTSKRTTNR